MFGFDFSTTTIAVNKKSGMSPSDMPGLIAWYDPSDLSSLFQDAAGTIPVASNGDPVGLMLDKSGNDHHMSQIIQTSRPTYETDGTYHWVSFDGNDDGLVAPAFDWGSSAATIIFSIAKLSDAAPGCLFETSANANNNAGTLALFAPNAQVNVGNYEFRATGGGAPTYLGVSGYPTPGHNILTGVVDLSAQVGSFFIDGIGQVLDRTVIGGTQFGNYAMYLGRRANSSLPFGGRFYGAVLGNQLISESERLANENWLMQRADTSV